MSHGQLLKMKSAIEIIAYPVFSQNQRKRENCGAGRGHDMAWNWRDDETMNAGGARAARGEQ